MSALEDESTAVLQDMAPRELLVEAAVELRARIRVVHGREEVAALEEAGDFEAFAGAFSDWIAGLAH